MRTKLDSWDIESFVAVGTTMNFKAAAEMLNMSPSALSRRIVKIETQLGTKLLERTTREVKLTLAGKQFLDRAHEILANIDQLVTVIKNEGAPRSTSVTIASIPSVASNVLPDAMRTFSEAHPTVRLKIKDMTTNDVLDAVQSGEAEFGITSYGTFDDALDFVPIIRAAYILVAPKDHELAGRRSVAWGELVEHRVISTWKSSGVRMVMDVELAKIGKRLNWYYEVQQMYTVLALVERGLGIAPVPSFFFSTRDARDMRAIPLIEPILWVDLGLVRRRGQTLRPHAAEFWDVMVEQLRRSNQAAGIGYSIA